MQFSACQTGAKQSLRFLWEDEDGNDRADVAALTSETAASSQRWTANNGKNMVTYLFEPTDSLSTAEGDASPPAADQGTALAAQLAVCSAESEVASAAPVHMLMVITSTLMQPCVQCVDLQQLSLRQARQPLCTAA